MAPTRASEYVDADVAIFNLFSEDSGRTNQNKLVEKTKGIFERNGLSVHIYGRDDFTINNLITAIEKNVLIYISSLGTSSGKVVLGQRRMTGDSVSWDYRGFVDETDFAKYDKANRYVINIPAALRDLHYSGPLVYLASCYTPENNNSDLHLVGWNGVNRVGQAYGLIFADYMIHWGKSFKAFSIDFSEDHSPYGTIYDPIEYDPKKEKNTTLIHYGNGWGADVFDDSGWTQQKNDNKVVIDQPTPGTCNKKLKYTVKLSYRNDGSIVTDGKTVTYENGNKYYFDYSDLGDEMTGIGWRSDPLRFKDNVVEYKVNGLTAGVWRFLSFNTADNVHYGDVNARDCTYAIFSHSFKENDVQEDDTPSVVTLETMAGTNDLVLGGAVINRSLAGLETGFQYWKKDAPTNKSTIATSTTYEDYFGAVLQIPDLDGEYEFRAFAKDEEGLIGYGDIQSFKYNGGSQQEYATPEIVDLGLSVKWASFNLGASKPEGYGDYFAWGETEPYYEPGYAQSESPVWKLGKEAGYDWPSYKWCKGTEITLTKYCTDSSCGYNGFTDGKTTLDMDDDAANVCLGEKWRTPTANEFNELGEKCLWEQEQLNGVNGWRVTGPNGNSIYIPSSGIRFYTRIYDVGAYGYYGSSSLYTENPRYSYYFLHEAYSPCKYSDRATGHLIRPVYVE